MVVNGPAQLLRGPPQLVEAGLAANAEFPNRELEPRVESLGVARRSQGPLI